jgi:hypothetical protein
MPRITVKQHHKQFLDTISAQMGVSHTVALDYLIFELRRTGFSFSSALSAPIPPQPLQRTGMFVPFQEVAPVTPPTATTSTDPEPDDEAITRIARLIEEF